MSQKQLSSMMKSDVTEASSSLASVNASEIPFSNRQQNADETKTAKHLPPTPIVTAPESAKSNKGSKKKAKKNDDGSLKSLIEDETNSSESTAQKRTPATAKTQTQFSPTTAAANHAPPGVVGAGAAPTRPGKNRQIRTTPVLQSPIFDGSMISPTTKEHPRQSRRYSGSGEDGHFLKKVNKNISHIGADHQKQFSWIRKLQKQKWIPFVDIVMVGFTLLFYSIAVYLVFHINPVLEYKFTSQYQTMVWKSINLNSFENCNHSSWIHFDNSTTQSIIDDSRCFSKYAYGRYIIETFKSLSPNSSSNNGCQIDRVEIHPCIENDSNIFSGYENYSNIFLGLDDEIFFCNGTQSTGILSFNPPVQKYHMVFESDDKRKNVIATSASFFFQCPKCNLISRTSVVNGDLYPGKWYYRMNETTPSIPSNFQKCYESWSYPCNFKNNHLIENCEKTFSQEVLNFTIVHDVPECRF